ncbi:MHC class II antigen [Anopheles sinensis]|uniref:MHC class II antigen n=1 Tax=Anopheles sinensis TaxID=74873 RepID=A0A084VWQ5_ANOSI|nr:MHC class II antigen [Anopheles sinensis]
MEVGICSGPPPFGPPAPNTRSNGTERNCNTFRPLDAAARHPFQCDIRPIYRYGRPDVSRQIAQTARL